MVHLTTIITISMVAAATSALPLTGNDNNVGVRSFRSMATCAGTVEACSKSKRPTPLTLMSREPVVETDIEARAPVRPISGCKGTAEACGYAPRKRPTAPLLVSREQVVEMDIEARAPVRLISGCKGTAEACGYAPRKRLTAPLLVSREPVVEMDIEARAPVNPFCKGTAEACGYAPQRKRPTGLQPVMA